MLNKKEIRQGIVNYLCGEEDLKDEFVDLLKSGGLSEYEGNIIKDNLLEKIDSGYDLDLLFREYYSFLYKIYHKLIEPQRFYFEKDDTEIIKYRICEDENDPFDEEKFPSEKLDEYTSDEYYLRLVRRHYPQSVDEAVDILIEGLDTESIIYAKESSKEGFRAMTHFGLALYVRNQFGLNTGKGIDLMIDIEKESGNFMLFTDDISGFLMEKLWDRIQEDYDEIILSKE